MHKPGVEVSKNIEKARRLYLTTPDGIMDSEMATILGVSTRTANRYRQQLGGKETFQNSYRYILRPDKDEIEFAKNLLQRMGYSIKQTYIDEAELEAKLQAEMKALEDDF